MDGLGLDRGSFVLTGPSEDLEGLDKAHGRHVIPQASGGWYSFTRMSGKAVVLSLAE